MQLIIKPTGRCNFNCSFCSAGNLNIYHSQTVSKELKEIIKLLNPEDLIFTGGDPLCVDPEYYEEILTLGDYTLSFTTNLKDFYSNPKKWIPLFENPRVSIGTSFQYGSGRLWDKNTIYDEKLFKEIMHSFNDKIGYYPSFISVISEENEDNALDHLYLAKELNTFCKLNAMRDLGRSKTFYPMHKIVKIWLDAIDLGLEKYMNFENQFKNGACCLNTNLLCESTIRVFWQDNQGNVKYGSCEDLASEGKFIPIDKETPQPIRNKIKISELIKPECLSCELCNFCNGCHKNRETNKLTKNHCEEMLKLKSRIKATKWKL